MADHGRDQDDRPEAPAFVSHVEGSAEMPEYLTPEQMAAAFGGPVHVPTCWPSGSEPRYAVYRPDPRATHQTGDYRCWIRTDLGLRGLVIGAVVRYPQEAGVGGWFAVPELSASNGIADSNGSTLLLDVDGHSLMFLAFPSFEEAVAAAASLRRVGPDCLT